MPWGLKIIAKVCVPCMTRTRTWKLVILAYSGPQLVRLLPEHQKTRKSENNKPFTFPFIYCIDFLPFYTPWNQVMETAGFPVSEVHFRHSFTVQPPLRSLKILGCDHPSFLLHFELAKLLIFCEERKNPFLLNDYLRQDDFFPPPQFFKVNFSFKLFWKLFFKILSHALPLKCPAYCSVCFRSTIAPRLFWTGYTCQ